MSEKQRNAEIGARMKAAAEEAGLSAYDVAAQLDVRAPTVYRWWGGTRCRMLPRYAELVKKPLIWLEAGEAVNRYVEESLRRWADLAAAGIAGDAALLKMNPPLSAQEPDFAPLLERVAPNMVTIIEGLAGRTWGELTEAEKGQAVRQLLDAMDRDSAAR